MMQQSSPATRAKSAVYLANAAQILMAQAACSFSRKEYAEGACYEMEVHDLLYDLRAANQRGWGHRAIIRRCEKVIKSKTVPTVSGDDRGSR